MKKLTKPALMVVTFLFLFAAVNGADDPKKSGSEKAAAKKDAKADAKKDAKADAKKESKGEAKKDRATPLPQHYNQIGLSDDQKEKVRSISDKYQAQIADLKKQIADLESKRDKEHHAILNDNQKKSLESLAASSKKGTTTVERGNREQTGRKALGGVGKKVEEANKAKQSEAKKTETKK